jgi:hypothetical protein
MQEMVRKFDDADFNVGKKVTVTRNPAASISAIAIILISLCSLGLTILGLYYLKQSGAELDADFHEGLFALIMYSIALLGAGIAILFNKNVAGGIVSIVLGILLSLGYWYFGIPVILAGIVAIKARENIEAAIIRIMQRTPEASISDIALQLKRTEADVEMALKKPQVISRNIAFDAESRMVRTG